MKVNSDGSTTRLQRKAKANSEWQLMPISYRKGDAVRLQSTFHPLLSGFPSRIDFIDVQIIKPANATIIHNR